MKPVDAVLAVTYRCNARCAMCGIWKAAPVPEIAPDVYRKLPSSLRDINLTGGEPFLRDDLVEIHAAAREACPQAQTILSTNGLLTERIVSSVKEMRRVEPNVGVAVSIDGPAETHDAIRGVRGAFDKATRTLRALLEIGATNLRVAYTATVQSVAHAQYVYDLAHEYGVEFTCAMEHHSEHYFHSASGETDLSGKAVARDFAPIMREELRTLSPKRWGRAYFMHGLCALGAGRGRLLPCRAGRDFFFMDPSGNVFTCNAAPLRMGNLAERSFEALWESAEAEEARARADRCDAPCWMVCTARTAIKRAWPRALAWALWHRLVGLDEDREAR